MRLGHQSAHAVMEDLPSPVKTREEKKEKEQAGEVIPILCKVTKLPLGN